MILVKGEAAQVSAFGVQGETLDVTHTQPGKFGVVPSLEDLEFAADKGGSLTMLARGELPNEVVSLTLDQGEVTKLEAMLDPEDPTQKVVTGTREFVRTMIEMLNEKGIPLPESLRGQADLLKVKY